MEEQEPIERDYLREAQEIVAGRSLYLPEREHLVALARGVSITPSQQRAIADAYTSLRSICETYGKNDEPVSAICCHTIALLMDEFECIARLHAWCNEVAK